jgi:DNA-directed RNA polymerase IV and V subunit 2
MEVCGCKHPSHWGKVCFLSTLDGENCGLVKNLTVIGVVSTNVTESKLPMLFVLGKNDNIFLNGD